MTTDTQTTPGVGAPLGVKNLVYDEALDRRGFVTSIRDSVAGTIEPAWVVEDATMPRSVTRYVEGVEGALAVAVGDGGLSVQVVDLHGDVVATVPVAGRDVAATWSGLVLARFDAFGRRCRSVVGRV